MTDQTGTQSTDHVARQFAALNDIQDAAAAGHTLWLSSMCLFSKWGFNDGDVPEAFLDFCDEHEIPYPSNTGINNEWHELLADVVERSLVPMLPVEVTVQRIGTIHNPIRAASVKGRPIQWRGGDAEHAHTFGEVVLEIPFSSVGELLAADRSEADRG